MEVVPVIKPSALAVDLIVPGSPDSASNVTDDARPL
jgi:hypothetical protein